MTLIASRTAISPKLIPLSSPCNALLESLMSTINRGIITGKANIAIIVLLFPVLELMPETIVNTVAKLILPKSTATKYSKPSPTGFLKITEYVK